MEEFTHLLLIRFQKDLVDASVSDPDPDPDPPGFTSGTVYPNPGSKKYRDTHIKLTKIYKNILIIIILIINYNLYFYNYYYYIFKEITHE